MCRSKKLDDHSPKAGEAYAVNVVSGDRETSKLVLKKKTNSKPENREVKLSFGTQGRWNGVRNIHYKTTQEREKGKDRKQITKPAWWCTPVIPAPGRLSGRVAVSQRPAWVT